MNAEQLLQNFDRIAESPGSIAHLRRFILDLAVRGKLVEQDPNDEPASELLKRIQVENTKLVSNSKNKQHKPESPIDFDEEPFPIPNNWTWTRLGEITSLVRGISFSASDKATVPGTDKLPCFRSGNIQKSIVWDNFIYVPKTALKSDAQLVCHNDILISIANSYELVGKSSIINEVLEAATFGAFLAAIRAPLLLPQFLQHFLSSNYSASAFRISSAQTTNIANITFGAIRKHIVALPPLAEQHRIVAKVDELMGLCDRLEAAQKDRESQRDRLVASSLHYLNQATEKAEFRDRAQFYFDRLPKLTTRSIHIKQLRQTILNLAVCGKLVPQDPNDEPASELLDRIQAQKQGLVKEGKIKKPKPLPEVEPEEIPYKIPKGWQWSNIQNISLKVTDGEHITPQRSTSGYFLLSARNVTNEGIKLDNVDYVPQQEYERIRKRCDPSIGDILVSCSGSVGRIAIVDANEYVMVRSVALIKYEHDFLSSSFLANTLKSPTVQSQIVKKSKTTAQSNLFLGKINEILVPIPPLAEQHRIVAKVDELMGLCDRLEAQIGITETDSCRLLESLLQQARSI